MKPRVLHVDLERAQRCVLHLRRKRVRHRVAENTQANRRIDIARDLRPFLKISECVTIGGLFSRSLQRRLDDNAVAWLRLSVSATLRGAPTSEVVDLHLRR